MDVNGCDTLNDGNFVLLWTMGGMSTTLALVHLTANGVSQNGIGRYLTGLFGFCDEEFHSYVNSFLLSHALTLRLWVFGCCPKVYIVPFCAQICPYNEELDNCLTRYKNSPHLIAICHTVRL